MTSKLVTRRSSFIFYTPLYSLSLFRYDSRPMVMMEKIKEKEEKGREEAGRLSTHWPLLLVLIPYIFIASLYAIYTPPWQAPDEPAHYNYVRQLATGQLPIMEEDDYNQRYQSDAISSRFSAEYPIEPFTYQDYQPPLYYLIQTPIYLISGGSLIAMRLFGVLLGTLTLTLTYMTLREFTIHNLQFTIHNSSFILLSLSLFAFLPQHVAIQASVNNDSLVELLVVATLFLLVRNRPGVANGGYGWGIPLLLSLAMLTKVTAYLLVPVIGLALIWRVGWHWRTLVSGGFRLFLLPFLVGCVWWGRNLTVYGWPDFLGTEAHDAAVIGQPTTAEWVEQFGGSEVLSRFLRTTFRSFWGQFGWMGVVMPTWVYQLLGLLTLVAFLGFVLYVMGKLPTNRSIDQQYTEHRTLNRDNRQIWPIVPILTALFSLNLLLYLTYNLTYVQHQGRYLFASLLPMAIAAGIGLSFWVEKSGLKSFQTFLALTFTVGLIGLDLMALFFFIIPALT